MTDVRGLVAEANAHARRRVRLTVLPAVVLLVALALWAVDEAAAGATRAWLLAAWAGALAVSLAGVGVFRYPSGGMDLAPARGSGLHATVLLRPPRAYWSAVATFAVAAALPAAAVVVLLAERNVLGALVMGVATVLLAIVPVLALLGRSVPGDLSLGRPGLWFRHAGARWAVEWDEVVEVEVCETLAYVRLGLTGDAADVVISLREWAVLPSDVGRLVLHLAAHPEAREETADPEAIRRRLDALALAPVPRRSSTWRVGVDSGLEDVDRQDADPERPVWDRTPVERALDVRGLIRARALVVIAIFGLLLSISAFGIVGPNLLGALASLGMATAAVAGALLVRASDEGRARVGERVVVRPGDSAALEAGATTAAVGRGVVLRRSGHRWRLLAVGGAGLALYLAMVTARFAQVWPVPLTAVSALAVLALLGPLLARTLGAWAIGEIALDEAALTVRSGWRTARFEWAQLAQADALWGSVVRFEGRDGTVARFDTRGVAVSPGELVRFVDRCARAGRLRGNLDELGTAGRPGR